MRRSTGGVMAVAAVAAVLSSAAPAQAATPVPGRYVVVARSASEYDALRAEAVAAGGRVASDMRQISAMVVVGGEDVRAVLAADSRTYGVEPDGIVQVTPPDAATATARVPGLLGGRPVSGITPDPLLDVPRLLWSIRRIDAPDAWNVTSGSPSVSVGVADTGLDFTNPELAPRIAHIEDFTAAEDPPLCKTFFTFNGRHFGDAELAARFNGPVTTDWNGHGSWIGGAIAGALDGVGLNGIAPNVELQALKIAGWCGSSYDSTELAAFLYAADHGIDVVNISFGGYLDRREPGGSLLYHLYVAAVRYAQDHGTVIAAAAGNEHVRVGNNGQVLSHGQLHAPGASGRDLFGLWQVPGGVPGVIDVSSTNDVNVPSSPRCTPAEQTGELATCKPQSDAHQAPQGLRNQLAYYSNYGPRIDVAGPGGARKFNLPVWDRGGTPGFPYTSADGLEAFEDFSVTSNWTTQVPCFTFPGTEPLFSGGACYSTIQGTSMAAPHAAAALALVASAFPQLRHHPRALVKRLYVGARNLRDENQTPPLDPTDTSPGDQSGVPCGKAFCHLGGAPIASLEAYGHGLVNAARALGAK
jgi:lantibiotic leader peptide-processing serine protease